jgi:hypothetical protein
MAIFAGTVAADGSAELHSDLFTAGRPKDGVYTIKLRKSLFAEPPAVVVTANIDGADVNQRVATVNGITADGFTVVIRNDDDNRRNCAFSFVMTNNAG